MPVLNWIGKDAVVNHHRAVPYRLVHCDGAASAGDRAAGNLLVQGDNLEALKALLPYYGGQVKCIYIDPPYNTGNEGWVYNDNVNAPDMRAWLGRVVGREAEDLSRHDKWLCMMYPRLRLLRDFLRQDGVIFVSIDDVEAGHLRLMMDEIFSERNFITQIVVEANARGQTYKAIARTHEHLLVYGKTNAVEIFELSDNDRPFKLQDERGGYELWNLRNTNHYFNRETSPTLFFPIYAAPESFERDHHRVSLERSSPEQIEIFPLDGELNDDCWRWSQNLIRQKDLSGNAPDLIARKVRSGKWSVYQRARKTTKKAKTIFKGPEYINQTGTNQLTSMGLRGAFDFPKPIGLLGTILELVTVPGDLILDSFAGSGTTGHAVLDLNKQDGGNRRFILVEMEEPIATKVTAARLRRVITGYNRGGDPDKPVGGLGGGFRYCRLGAALFDEFGDISAGVTFADLAAHIFFTETGMPIPSRATGTTPLLGTHGDRAVYLLFTPRQEERQEEGSGTPPAPS